MSTDRHQRLSSVPSEILSAFGLNHPVVCTPIVDGHINDSLVVSSTTGRATDRPPLFLQRINHEVFKNPLQVQENIVAVTQALRGSERHANNTQLRVIKADDGAPLAVDTHGWSWRAFVFIAGARTQLKATQPADAFQAAQAFGQFQHRLREFDVALLHETIPYFHHTPHRFEQLDAAIEQDEADRLREVEPIVEDFLTYRSMATRLLDLMAAGVPLRAVHNDAKLSNVLLDQASGASLCVIDLDTVMPGLSLFDVGEMVRSMGHTTPEDERDAQRIQIRPDFFRAIITGYLDQAGDLLQPVEREHLYDAALIMTLENGVRFLTDYLNGDHYFRIKRPRQNLDRAKAHLALLASLTRQENELRRLGQA